jgi:aspartate racemase
MSVEAVVGVIGGMGPAATVDFFQRLVETDPATSDADYVHVIVDSDPRVPDRTAFLLDGGADPRPALVATARRLECAGATLLVMPCNSAHAFAEAIRAAVEVPLVDWPAEAVREVVETGVTAVAPLTAAGTARIGMYRHALERHGIRCVEPTPSEQADLTAAIAGPAGVKRAGPASEPAHRLLTAVARALAKRGAQAILLGCTELSALHGRRPLRAGVPVLDAAQIVAGRTLARVGALAPAERRQNHPSKAEA